MAQPLFRQDNTEGYTDDQLATLNTEFAQRLLAADWMTLTEADAAKAFMDEVAQRTEAEEPGSPRREQTITYRATKRWENGRKESAEFADYADMCRWFAADPEAGIKADVLLPPHGVETAPVEQRQLQDDVEAYL